MNTTRKRVKLIEIPTNIRNTYTKNEYQRANLEQLIKNMKVGKQVVTVGKANAFSKGRPLNVNNISERRNVTKNNTNRLTKAYINMKRNRTNKRKRVLNNAEFAQLMRNINEERRMNMTRNGGRRRYKN